MGNQCHIEKKQQKLRQHSTNDHKILQQKQIGSEKLFRVGSQQGKSIVHQSICAIRFAHKAKSTKLVYGSGVLISKDIVLTVAHNIFDKKHKDEADPLDYEIYVGVNGITDTFYQVEDWRYLSKYKTCDLEQELVYDYAIIKLKKEVELMTLCELSLPCQCVTNKSQYVWLKIFGYPLYQNYKPKDESGRRIELHQYGLARQKSIVSADKFMMLHTVSTLKGQSGCPIVIDNKIIAIHKGAPNQDYTFNAGRLFTQQLLRNIQKWIDELKGHFCVKSRENTCRLCSKEKTEDEKLALKKAIYKEVHALCLEAKNFQNLVPPNINQAKRFYSKAFRIVEGNFGKDYLGLAPIIHQLGVLQLPLAKYTKAIKHYDEAIRIYRKHKTRSKDYAGVLQDRGRASMMIFQYKTAREYLQESVMICEELKGSIPDGGVQECTLWYARCLKGLEDWDAMHGIMQKYGLEYQQL